MLEENGIKVKDVIVLIDREHGAAEHLRHHGYNLLSILKLDVMLTHYMSKGLISEETYRTCAEYSAQQTRRQIPLRKGRLTRPGVTHIWNAITPGRRLHQSICVFDLLILFSGISTDRAMARCVPFPF